MRSPPRSWWGNGVCGAAAAGLRRVSGAHAALDSGLAAAQRVVGRERDVLVSLHDHETARRGGYYVFPVAVIDQFLKDNGMPTPDEMHTASLAKIREIIGADAVLYVTITEWGQKYQVLQSTTVVHADAKLVDTVTGTTLWEGSALAPRARGRRRSIAMLIAAAIDQVIDTSTDRCHDVARAANFARPTTLRTVCCRPSQPEYASDKRGR